MQSRRTARWVRRSIDCAVPLLVCRSIGVAQRSYKRRASNLDPSEPIAGVSSGVRAAAPCAVDVTCTVDSSIRIATMKSTSLCSSKSPTQRSPGGRRRRTCRLTRHGLATSPAITSLSVGHGVCHLCHRSGQAERGHGRIWIITAAPSRFRGGRWKQPRRRSPRGPACCPPWSLTGSTPSCSVSARRRESARASSLCRFRPPRRRSGGPRRGSRA